MTLRYKGEHSLRHKLIEYEVVSKSFRTESIKIYVQKPVIPVCIH
jgi:hypothetical protein